MLRVCARVGASLFDLIRFGSTVIEFMDVSSIDANVANWKAVSYFKTDPVDKTWQAGMVNGLSSSGSPTESTVPFEVRGRSVAEALAGASPVAELLACAARSSFGSRLSTQGVVSS